MLRLLRSADRWLPATVAGTALGLLGWFLFRELATDGGGGKADDEPDLRLADLRRVLRVAGAEEVRVRRLAPGIVELVGRVDAAAREERLLDVAARQPGVSVVVNRLWHPTPEVSRPRPDGPESGTDAELT